MIGWWRSRRGLRPTTRNQGRPEPHLVVSVILVLAMMMLIWNGSSFLANAEPWTGINVKVSLAMLALNVALILVGWRRLADLEFENERVVEAERRAAHLASSDVITGLANRKGLADRGQVLREAVARDERWLAVISVRLHRFKWINDRHGYEAGDSMLRQIAAALTAAAPAEAIIARLNGDEFAVALPVEREHCETAEALAGNLLRICTSPFEVGGKMLQVGAYAGIAAGRASECSLPDLLRRGDIALDRAKNGRVARPIWFDDGMERALMAHVEIEQGIRYALEHHQFEPFFEPQMDLSTGEVIGFEMLARWRHPLSGIITPEVFIPVAEEHGLIGQLSEQVIAAALQVATRWDKALSLSVNISPSQLADPWLAQKLVRLLTEANFPPSRLIVEITESSLFADLELARSITASLKNQGVKLSLDDFGTGFSSLSHLRSLPFDSIKIDRSFVKSIVEDRESAAIVRAVTDLANAIGVPVTAEGIEDAATHARVLGFGCAIGQGWYFGKPMSADQAEQFLRRKPVETPDRRSVAG